jgi:hypothetical protein
MGGWIARISRWIRCTKIQKVKSELQIETDSVTWAESKGILTRKYTTPGRSGAPDRIYMYGGKTCWIEWKKPKKTARALQLIEMDAMADVGQQVAVHDNLESGIAFLRHVFSL